jgi:ABC-2 type transport system ATP-binding protein
MLISSHELAEIEGVATHIGFLDRGELLFQEAMDDLAARVREVHVTLEGDAALPAKAPAEWLNIKTAGSVVSFVDTRFNERDLALKVAAVLGSARRIEARPVELRSIFTAIARSIRQEAA